MNKSIFLFIKKTNEDPSRVIISIAITISFFFFFFLKNHFYSPSFLNLELECLSEDNETNTLEITNLENKWFSFIPKIGERRIQLEEFEIEAGNWNFWPNSEDPQRWSTKKAGSTIKWRGVSSTFTISFPRHTSGGRIKIRWNDKEKIIDTKFKTTKWDHVKFHGKGSLNIKWDSGNGFNEYEKTNTELKSNIRFALPQYKFNRIMVESQYPENKFKIKSAYIRSSDNKRPLSFDIDKTSSVIFNFDSQSLRIFHPTLFTVQLLLSLFLGWLSYEILGLKNKCKQTSWKLTIEYIFFKNRHWVFWLMFFASFSIFLLYLIGQWPGYMSPDSLDSWNQMKKLRINNHHPWIYQIYYLALTQFINSPSIISLTQIFISSVLGSYIFYFAIKNKVSPILILPFFFIFILSPAVGIYNVILWKNVTFALLVSFWGFYLFKLYHNKRKYKKSNNISKKQIIIISFLLYLVSTIHHSGLIYLIIIPFVIYFLKLLPIKKLISFICLSFTIFLTMQLFITTFFNIEMKTPVHTISGIINPYSFMVISKKYYSPNIDEDIKNVEKISGFDIEYIKENYDPTSTNISAMNVLNKDERETILKTFYSRIPYNLHFYLADRSIMFLSMLFSKYQYLFDTGFMPLEKYVNTSNLSYNPKSEKLNALTNSILEYSKSNINVQMIIWNSYYAFVLLLTFFLLYKWLPMMSLYSFIILIQLPVYFFVAIANNNFRHLYFLFYAGFFIVPLFLTEMKVRNDKNNK